MEKKIAGLLGAVAALGTLTSAQAAPGVAPLHPDSLQVNSYAELLEPIPNAAIALKVLDERGPVTADANIQLAQYHHHHHHSHWRRAPVVVIGRHRHHHHHHHHNYRRD